MMAGRQARPGERATEGAARHIPVLLHEVLAALTPRDGEVFVDGTFGAGGYTSAILGAADVRVIAIDQDPNALAAGQALVEKYAPRLILSEGRFGDLDHIAAEAGFLLSMAWSSISAFPRCNSTRPIAASPSWPTVRSICACRSRDRARRM